MPAQNEPADSRKATKTIITVLKLIAQHGRRRAWARVIAAFAAALLAASSLHMDLQSGSGRFGVGPAEASPAGSVPVPEVNDFAQELPLAQLRAPTEIQPACPRTKDPNGPHPADGVRTAALPAWFLPAPLAPPSFALSSAPGILESGRTPTAPPSPLG